MFFTAATIYYVWVFNIVLVIISHNVYGFLSIYNDNFTGILYLHSD